MPAQLPEDKIAALSELIFRGRKIEAIKMYRELTRLGLKEAKEEVEALETSLRKDFPEKFVAAPRGKGCFGTAAILCTVVLIAGYWIISR